MKHIYFFKSKSGKLKVSFSLCHIDKIAMSHQSDNFMLIKFKSDGSKLRSSILIAARGKIQIQILQTLVEQTGSESLAFPLSVTDRFQFLHSDGH
jgi:hypothetical protein